LCPASFSLRSTAPARRAPWWCQTLD
jgi:hypothetical protein